MFLHSCCYATEVFPVFLEVDFGSQALDLAPVTSEEFKLHQAADGAKFIDRLWRIRQKLVERYLLPAGLPTR